MESLVDILGQTIRPGDFVVYPQMSGRSVQMVLGQVVSFTEKTAQVRRVQGSRWLASYQSTRYRDKVTGKGIDPWATDKHWIEKPKTVYIHRETGEEVSYEEFRDAVDRIPYHQFKLRREIMDSYYSEYRKGKLKDYVEKYVPEPKPVTISNLSNLVKVDYVPVQSTTE